MTVAESPLPLCSGFTPGAPIGCRAGEPIAIERYICTAVALAGRLPRGGYCVNACDDRLNFLVGLAAALMARSITLLPQSRAPQVLRGLVGRYAGAYRITDLEDAWADGPSFGVGAWPEPGEPLATPEFPAQQDAVILFTSGTTGMPSPHAKSWGSLVAGAHALRARVPIAAGATIVGAVPPQHMWGLETTVMLPLQSGCAVDSACPLLPAEITAALGRHRGARWLVATPAHLRACMLSGAVFPQLAGVLCSTAQLPEETARDVEERSAAPLFEIYGSTETGVIATRRTAQTRIFDTIDGVSIAISDDHAVAAGGHVGNPVHLNDMLDSQGGGRFAVQGRTADLVKIGGKRGSLAAFSAELNRVPGVLDGVFWLPETTAAVPRLMAFAVAPGVERSAILGRLRECMESVFLPRPLLLVDALPRNAAGKLSRDALATLAATAQPRESADRSEAGAHAWQSVPAWHPSLQGHFPGHPVVPGVWLLALVEREAQRCFGDELSVSSAPEVSFRTPVLPNQAFRIILDRIAEDRIRFRIEGTTLRIADGTVLMRRDA